MKTAIVCIAKNEDHYIDEWVDYHLKLGFDDVFIFQNNWRAHLKKQYSNVHLIEFDYNFPNTQGLCYNTFIQRFSTGFDFAAFFDVDEFLVLKKYNNVNNFLSDYTEVDAIGVNWRVFGDSHMPDPTDGNYSVLDRFTLCDVRLNKHVKLIVNLKRTDRTRNVIHDICVHYTLKSVNCDSTVNVSKSSFIHGPFSENDLDKCMQIAYLNHYRDKTRAEAWEKANTDQNGIFYYNPYIKNFEADFNAFNINDVEDLTAKNFFHKKQEVSAQSTDSGQMNLFFSATKDYVIHVAELIFSIRRFSNRIFNAYVIVDDDDCEKYTRMFNEFSIEKLNIRFFPVDILDKSLSPYQNTEHLTKMTYGRLMAFSLLKDIDRVLYLDADMLVKAPGLDCVYDMDLKGKYAAVVEDISMFYFNRQEMDDCHVKKYFNGGFMLMDLQAMRRDGIDKQCIDMLLNPPDFLKTRGFQDQSIINSVFRENVEFISPKFNVQSILVGYPQYTKFAKDWGFADQADMFDKCIIQHMQGAKPWEERWQTWQVWQLPYKQWQYDYYQFNKSEFIKSCAGVEVVIK